MGKLSFRPHRKNPNVVLMTVENSGSFIVYFLDEGAKKGQQSVRRSLLGLLSLSVLHPDSQAPDPVEGKKLKNRYLTVSQSPKNDRRTAAKFSPKLSSSQKYQSFPPHFIAVPLEGSTTAASLDFHVLRESRSFATICKHFFTDTVAARGALTGKKRKRVYSPPPPLGCTVSLTKIDTIFSVSIGTGSTKIDVKFNGFTSLGNEVETSDELASVLKLNLPEKVACLSKASATEACVVQLASLWPGLFKPVMSSSTGSDAACTAQTTQNDLTPLTRGQLPDLSRTDIEELLACFCNGDGGATSSYPASDVGGLGFLCRSSPTVKEAVTTLGNSGADFHGGSSGPLVSDSAPCL